MSAVRSKPSPPQLVMPGMFATIRFEEQTTCCHVSPGQEVLYLGRLNGGPHYGAPGVIKKTLLKKALVDLGSEGTWNVPYYLLALPQAA